MTNRTRDDIVVSILEFLDTESTFRTHVMFNARLSYAQLKHYRLFLLSKGLVDEVNGKWAITEKGREYLRACVLANTILQS